MHLSFLGGADTVTGSRHLVEIGSQRVVLDCGMFQGFKLYRERNWEPPPAALRDADAVVLSHAHLDHCGWLPVLVRSGFAGRVIASPATRDLAEVMLLDSAHLQEEDARRARRGGYSRHAKAMPLYTTADAQRAIARIQALSPGRTLMLGGRGGVALSLHPAGHLLGACSVRLQDRHESLLYSGDLGRRQDLLMPAPQAPSAADVLIVESTYGNRWHAPGDAAQALASLIRRTVSHGGSVLIPSFAVGRAQALLVVLQRLRAAGQIPRELPIFLDSPMAMQATAVYRRHRRLLRIAQSEVAGLLDDVRVVDTPQASMRLSHLRYPAVILSASGMATGGRVLHHLKALAPDPRHHVVFAGFQVPGSRGAALVAGATEVKIHGEFVPVRAAVTHLEGFSGHADSDELVAWLRAVRRPPRACFIVHGEAAASDALRLRVQDELGWTVRVAPHGQRLPA